MFYGHQGRLEYDFDIAPGADSSRIGLSVRGARRVWVDSSGALVLDTLAGRLRELAPRAYQVIGGRRVTVASRYVLGAGDVVRVVVGGYDHARMLVIDPALDYSTFLGGSSGDIGYGVAVDSSGAAYVTGVMSSSDFPTSAGAYQTTLNGTQDAFVSKLAADGTSLDYSTYLGGSGSFDYGQAIAVDSSGAAYVTGYTQSGDFPTSAGAYQTTLNGVQDAFVSKLAADGTSLAYSTYLGGSSYDRGYGIAVDSSGAAYVTGFTLSGDFPTSAGAYQTTLNGSVNAFVSKLAADGTSLAYSTYLGGSSDDRGYGDRG